MMSDKHSDEYKAGYYDAYIAVVKPDEKRFMVNGGHNDYAKGIYDGDNALINEYGRLANKVSELRPVCD